MPHFTTSRQTRHGATDMFDLVADVEAYPGFVPLCDSLVVRSRNKDGDSEVVIATMTIAYKLLRESFTSRVVLNRKALTIHVSYLDGPFSRMENVWRFEPHGRGNSVVHFTIDYEFRSKALSLLMGSVFDRAFRKFAAAFEARADVVYGAA